ncbi:hypothetical protein [Streptomyces niveiscabiei]|uniref:Novel STAND NTPase 1 domain-containing protein n=1 Tax=Streptomyces niveiscabiei TaxID=164115 RepID=A0ABW9HYP3_9ACTN
MHDPYRVVAWPPLSPRDASATELEALAEALNSLPAPVTTALDDLTGAMVERAFGALGPKERQEVLHHLGIRMTAPRRVSHALCRDVLSRLRREVRQHACRCTLRRLTQTPMGDLAVTVFTDRDDTLLDRWDGPLLRATVLAWSNGSVSDAHVVAWAVEQEWFAWDTPGLDAVRAAAHAVLAANPDFVPDAFATEEGDEVTGGGLASDEVTRGDSLAGEPTSDEAMRGDSLAGEPTPDEPTRGGLAGGDLMPGAPARGDSLPGGSTPDAPTPDGQSPEDACRVLADSLAGAGVAARRVTEAVADGRPPEETDLASLTALRAAFDITRGVLAKAGIDVPVPRLEELTEAVRTHRESLGLRETLRALSAVGCPADSPVAPAAEAVRGVAVRLLAVGVWGEAQRHEATTLAALADLVRLGRCPETAAERMALQDRVAPDLPVECTRAAMMAYELTLPEAGRLRDSGTSDEDADGTGVTPSTPTQAAPHPGKPEPTQATPAIPHTTPVTGDAARTTDDGEPEPTKKPEPATTETPAPVAQGSTKPLGQENAAPPTTPAHLSPPATPDNLDSPANPAASGNPAHPGSPAAVGNAVDLGSSAASGNLDSPADLAHLGSPAASGDSGHPGSLATPGSSPALGNAAHLARPAGPGNLDSPADPAHLASSAASGDSGHPGSPAAVGNAVDLGSSTHPGNLAAPGSPADLGSPAASGNPAHPAHPDSPLTLDSPAASGSSAHSGSPAAPGTPPTSGNPTNPDTPPAPDTPTVPDPTPALAHLIATRRFGLAHHLARAAGHPASRSAALRLAGAAGRLVSGVGPDARFVGGLVRRQGGCDGEDELVLFPALLRVALVTGDHTAGAQLKALVPRLPEVLAELAAAVADRALSGALMMASPLGVIADASAAEARMSGLRAQAADLLAPQRLRFVRADRIARCWLGRGGLLGAMLRAVVEDDRAALRGVRETADRLSKLSEINAEIDRMDRAYRGSSGKPLQGSGRQDLVHLVERAAVQAKEWCLEAGDARRGDHSGVDRAAKEISSLRQTLLDRRDVVLTELHRMTLRPDPLASAVASAANGAMEDLFTLLTGTAHPGTRADGTRTDGTRTDPETALDVELLKVCDTLQDRPGLALLLTAVDRTWDDALTERLNRDAFTAARTILDLARTGELPAHPSPTTPTHAEIDALETARHAALTARRDELTAELRRAQADGAVTDDQDLELQELLDAARTRLDDLPRPDLLDVRQDLDTVRDRLPAYRREATARIRARLDAAGLDHGRRPQILRHLDAGELATAADLVYFLEIGEDVPEIDAGECHLTEFFPAVPDGLPKGIDEELVRMVRSGGRHPALPVLDYGHLSPDEAALAADALEEWREVGAAERKERNNAPVRQQVLSALKLLGYDAKNARLQENLSPDRREYRFYDAIGVEVNGRAEAPAFGSQIKERGGSLRVLVLWGRPPAEVVMSRAAQDPSGSALVVVCFGVLGRDARAELAAGTSRLQPLLVVDDAALAYLAARGNRQAATTTRILLPFSGVNPYISEKRGQIGAEMFYGRDAERRSILDPRGTQVIFGGRGLGKSALLSDAGERFEEQRPGYHQSVHVNLDHENIGKGTALGPEALWSVLNRVLTRAGVLPDRPPKGRRSARHTTEKPQEQVREGIRAWLDGDSRRGLLILLDECDQFFEADAPRFEQTKLLKGLGSGTKDRAKVVFAGLHSVQRFAKLASNGPFGHLAQTPTVIGPLAPQHAADLLVGPMRALGFEFASVDLVNRVLGHCSYQPFLLQMFGHRLVEVMHRKRRRGAEGPPYAVEAADVETVEADTGLKDRISVAFNDTLALDHRYDVIANVLAHQAHHHGLETRLSDAELREECETYWRAGFRQLDTEGFRAYLSEMVGLGVLAPNNDGQGWHLRGPNALRMIGGSHRVDDRLMRAEQDCELKESIVLEGRPELSDGRLAPLTVAQLDDLLGRRANQTRVVLGTPATGIAEVSHTLHTVTGRIDGWVLPPVGRPAAFKQALTGGSPGERRVVVDDLAWHENSRGRREPVKPEACRAAVDHADSLVPVTPGVTRSVVIVTDAAHLALWRPLLMGEERTSAVPVVLRRHDRRGLRDWAQRQWAETCTTADRLYARTGGWPLLVDRAHHLYGELRDADEVLERLSGLLTDRSWARDFVTATGVLADPALAAGYHAVDAGLGDDPADTEAVLTALVCQTDDEEEAHWVLACLDALQVFDREDGQLRLEPVLRQCARLTG